MVVKVSSGWIRGVVGSVRAQMSAGAVCERAARCRRSDVYLGRFWKLERGRFEIPRSTRKGRQPAARFAISRRWCLLAVVGGISRAEARTVTRKSSLWREK